MSPSSDFWQSSYAKKAINKTVQAVKNAEVITKAKNTVSPANIKAATAKTYEDVIKSPIAKTQAAMEKMREQLARHIGWNNDLVPVGASRNTGWRIEKEETNLNFHQFDGNGDGGKQTKGMGKSESTLNIKFREN